MPICCPTPYTFLKRAETITLVFCIRQKSLEVAKGILLIEMFPIFHLSHDKTLLSSFLINSLVFSQKVQWPVEIGKNSYTMFYHTEAVQYLLKGDLFVDGEVLI